MLEHCNPTVPGTVRIMVFIYRDKDAVLLMLLGRCLLLVTGPLASATVLLQKI